MNLFKCFIFITSFLPGFKVWIRIKIFFGINPLNIQDFTVHLKISDGDVVSSEEFLPFEHGVELFVNAWEFGLSLIHLLLSEFINDSIFGEYDRKNAET